VATLDVAQARQMFFREDVINSLGADEVSCSSANHLAVLIVLGIGVRRDQCP